MIELEELVSFAKNYGFVYQGSEIYGGLANTWDYGPLGVELKNNIKQSWWQAFVRESVYNVGLDSSILMNPQVWVSSGHVGGFSDPLTDCRACNSRFRADQLIEEQLNRSVDGLSSDELSEIIKNESVKCPSCGKSDFTEIRSFNLMFKTQQGVVEGKSSDIYLRPETAQGIFVNFKNIARSQRLKVPFGVAQVGKSFRNEITPGNFIFRTREFEQMELEFFCKPGTEFEWMDYWKNQMSLYLNRVGLSAERIRFRDHDQEELSHYSNATSDVEYDYGFRWGELWGIASRTDFDLKAHQDGSKQNLEYFDDTTNEKYIPYVIEPSLGVERLFLAILADAYVEEEERQILKLKPALAPYKVCLLPLVKKYHSSKAKELYMMFAKEFSITYDEAGSIGKRYARQDVIGTPFCITIDDNTVNDNTVTIRFRDSMEQITLTVEEAIAYVKNEVRF